MPAVFGGCRRRTDRLLPLTHTLFTNKPLQDLAVLINDQGQQLMTVDQQIASTAERTHDGVRQLVKAERSQRAARNKCLLLWLVAGIIVALILVVLFGG